MIIGTLIALPAKFPFHLVDRNIVDGGVPHSHQSVVVEFPVLVAARAEPRAGCVVIFVAEPHRDLGVGTAPQFLDQFVPVLLLPLPGQEIPDLVATGHERGAVPPDRVGRVRHFDPVRILRVPSVLGHANLLRSGLSREGRERRLRFRRRRHYC